jgi:hypothetical protein
MHDIIDEFKDKHRFLSNFYESPIIINNQKWLTVEHVFQASKTTNLSEREYMRNIKTPMEVRRYGKTKVQLRSDWEDVKLNIMLKSLYLKFTQNNNLTTKLLQTRGWELVEGNTFHDNYWGNCTCFKCSNIPGQNNLGRLLMYIRDVAISKYNVPY